MPETLVAELEAVRAIAIQAGEVLLEKMGQIQTIDYKGTVDMVTDIDRRVEAMILSQLVSLFPEDTILAEESGGGQSNTGRTWFVDPLDGTTNYVHGYPFFSVSIACAEKDKILLGVVYAPYLDELYLATCQTPSELERLRAGFRRELPRRQPHKLEQALLATGFPYDRGELVDRNVEYVRQFLRANCHGVRRGGSAAIDLVHTAAGKLDGYWEMSLRPWDVAAGTLVARQAGVLVSGFDGTQKRMQWDNVVAAPTGLHEQMLAVLQTDSTKTSGEE